MLLWLEGARGAVLVELLADWRRAEFGPNPGMTETPGRGRPAKGEVRPQTVQFRAALERKVSVNRRIR